MKPFSLSKDIFSFRIPFTKLNFSLSRTTFEADTAAEVLAELELQNIDLPSWEIILERAVE